MIREKFRPPCGIVGCMKDDSSIPHIVGKCSALPPTRYVYEVDEKVCQTLRFQSQCPGGHSLSTGEVIFEDLRTGGLEGTTIKPLLIRTWPPIVPVLTK